MKKRNILSETALGNIPPDTVIANGLLYDAFTREFIKKQSIWIKEGMIAYVGPDPHPDQDEKTQVIDAEGRVLLPGLIDGHTHLMGIMIGIEEFVRHVIPTGVTTVITETNELALIVGKEGVECLVKGLEEQPIRFYYTAPPMCGLTSSEEVNALSDEDLLTFLNDPKCLGVGEIYWGNIFLTGKQGERLKELVSGVLKLGKRIEGHTAGASGRKLQAYADLGASSCHEPITEKEVLERLRLGYWVMVREGSVRKELDGIKGIFKKKIDFRRLALVTDGVNPEDFLNEGYLDAALRHALKLGVPPKLVYQMATLNTAEHFRIDHLIGSLSPGKASDILMIPSPDEFSPQLVMCNGKVIYQDGKATVEPRKVIFPDTMFDTVKIQDDFMKSGSLEKLAEALPKAGKVRAIELVTRLVTGEKIVDLENPEDSKDVIMLLALDRLGRGIGFMGFLKGFGLRQGAYGTTMCWDMPDMIVVGCDTPSMETVIKRLKEMGGGGAYAIGKEVIAEFPAPLCGIVSLKPMEVIHKETKRIEELLKENGVKWEKPLLTVDTLGTAAIPHLRISPRGYVRLKDRKIFPVEV